MANIPTKIIIQLDPEDYGSTEKRYFIKYKDSITGIIANEYKLINYSALTTAEKLEINAIELQAKNKLI